MSYLSKLNFKTVTRSAERDPVAERRAKFVTSSEEQRLVVAAALKGVTYTKTLKSRDSEPPRDRAVRPWFFQKDNGWYLQPRYGAQVLLIDGKSNAIFATKLADVDSILVALVSAAQNGELDTALALVRKKKDKNV